MRILFIGQQSLQSPSGVGRHFPMAKELVKLGHQVRIVTLHHDWQNLTQRRTIEDGVEIEYASQMQVLKRKGNKRYFSLPQLIIVTILAVFRLYGLIDQSIKDGFDTVHLMKPQPVNSLAWLLLPYRIRNRCRLFLDCDDFETGSAVNPSWWMVKILNWFELYMPHQAQTVTVNTDFMYNYMLKNGVVQSKLIKLPNGVERKRFTERNLALESTLMAKYRDRAEPLVIYIGTLSIFTHDLDLLLGAFAKLIINLPTARLLLVGDGEDRKQLERIVSERGLERSVSFTGAVDSDYVPSYLRIATVSVEPTRKSLAALGRSPLKIVESLACGTPVVCGAVGERMSILTCANELPVGILVAPDDAQALADGIEQLLTNPALRKDLARRGKLRAEEYMWDRLVDRLSALHMRDWY